MVLRHNRIHINLTGWMIAMGIFCYLITLGLIEIAHEHEVSDSHDCSACFFSANHLGIALQAVDLPNLDSCISIHHPFDPAFISTAVVGNVRSRAPPASTA